MVMMGVVHFRREIEFLTCVSAMPCFSILRPYCVRYTKSQRTGGGQKQLDYHSAKKRRLWNQVVPHVESVWQVKNRTAC